MEEERKQAAIADAAQTESCSRTSHETGQDQPEGSKSSALGPRRTAERELRVSLADEDGSDSGQRPLACSQDSLEIRDQKEKESRVQIDDH